MNVLIRVLITQKGSDLVHLKCNFSFFWWNCNPFVELHPTRFIWENSLSTSAWWSGQSLFHLERPMLLLAVKQYWNGIERDSYSIFTPKHAQISYYLGVSNPTCFMSISDWFLIGFFFKVNQLKDFSVFFNSTRLLPNNLRWCLLAVLISFQFVSDFKSNLNLCDSVGIQSWHYGLVYILCPVFFFLFHDYLKSQFLLMFL